jgi:hypothetical protein
MAGGVSAIQLGFDYQFVWFWIQACRLFHPSSKVLKVTLEGSRVKSFDDIVVHYSQPVADERNDSCKADYFQVKFHVDHSGMLRWEAFMDPGFINAEKFSLLQKLQTVQKQYAPNGYGVRFYLITNWPIDPKNLLAKLVSNQGGEIRFNELHNERMRILREKWKNHLNLTSDEELDGVLRPLRIHIANTLSNERATLNSHLINAGLQPPDPGRVVSPYEDLARKCLERGENEFTKERIYEICSREGLLKPPTQPIKNDPILLGIRSRMNWAEYLEDKTSHLLCLVHYFDNRLIRDTSLWHEAIYPELDTFLRSHVRGEQSFHLQMEAHSTIAFSAGYCLAKSGSDVAPLQRTQSNLQAWKPSSPPLPRIPYGWSFSSIEGLGSGEDIAIAISANYNITSDVTAYVRNSLPQVSRLVACTLGEQVGSASILDANHALSLAESLVSWLRTNRTYEERCQKLHIFAAAPNGFLFFLGKLALSLGRLQLYEFEFGGSDPAAYYPSLAFPPFQSLGKKSYL